MNKFRVVLATKSSFDFKQIALEGYEFDLQKYKVMFRKISSEVDQKLACIKFGWFIEIELMAKDINTAVSEAYDVSELFLSMLSLETGVESHRSTQVLAYDITEGISERDFIQLFYDLPISRPQQADIETYFMHLESVLLYKGEHQERLYRSIRWFRKGINENDPLDQFLALYQGLETLNPLLAKHFNCPNAGKEIIERVCVKSGNTFYSENTTKQGLEELVNEVKLDKKTWTKITKTRNSISHGFGKFEGLYEDALRLSPYLAKLLHEGISLVLGFEFEEKVTKHLENIAPIKVGEMVYLENKLLERDLDKLATKDYPHPYLNCKFEVVPIENGFTIKQKVDCVTGCEVATIGLVVSGRGAKMELDSIK